MKINNGGNKMAGVESAQNRKVEQDLAAVKQQKAKDSTGVEDSAQLNLSSKAQAFQKAKQIASKSDINHDKVARLQSLIDQGKYNVDAGAIADRLVDEHLKMNN